MLNQIPYILMTLSVYLIMAVPIILLAFFLTKKLPTHQKTITGFIIYGLISGFVSSYWWTISDMPWLSNLPAEIIGYRFHANSLWILNLPFIFIPVSIVFWGFSGLLVQKFLIKTYETSMLK